MTNRLRLLVLLAFLISGSVAQSQDQITIDAPLTFKEAVKLAIDNNVSLKQQQNQISANNITKTASLMQLGPSVSINGNVGRNDGNSFNQQEGRPINGILDFTNASVNASLPLIQGLNRVNNFKANEARLDAQIETVERTKQNIIQLVTARYLQCLLDQELEKISQRNLEAAEKQLEQIGSQVNAGSRAEVDKINQEFQVKNAELNLLRAQNTLRNDKASLAQTLQLDPIVNFNLQEPSWDVNQVDVNISVDELYQLALNNRSDLEGAKYSMEASKYNYRSTKGTYYPSVNAFFNYSSAYNYIHPSVANPTPSNRTFDQQFREDNIQKTFGLSFNIPIFSGFRNRSNVVQSKVAYDNASLNVAGLEVTVKSEVLLAHQNLQDAIKTFNMTKTQLEAAELSFDLGTQQYELGSSSLVEYTQANRDLVRAKVDYANSRYTLMFQEYLLNYATGTLSFEDIK